ncbi:MAG TPA: class I SAM-dependent methyltransferase [Gemmatimonadales bacterium]|jgi:methyltransferase (TIGR00027 family)|nr:class I SAM-dependent methyltransferase [Gemmatimonadales bacterium]HEV8598796.1 class I SAM-dependent methyltransferase [Gemmatimonadales bacterium]
MTTPTTTPIRNVSDTARWVAFYRAMESERPDAIFHDPFARRLAGEQGEAIVNAMPKGRQFAWPMIVRTAVMDEIILRVIAEHGVDCVLNLAAGLDARPWRLPLPASLLWVDVDLPVMLDHKEATLQGEKPSCRYEGVRCDLSNGAERRALFRRIGSHAFRALVITEGLLVYLTPAAVAELAKDLHSEESFAFWLSDLGSPGLLKLLAKTWGSTLAAGNAPMQFAPAEGTRFFGPYGWREKEYRSMFEESIRLKRTMRFARFWRLIGKLYPRKKQEEFKRFSGIILLERV